MSQKYYHRNFPIQLLLKFNFILLLVIFFSSCNNDSDLFTSINNDELEENIETILVNSDTIVKSTHSFLPTDDIYLVGNQGFNDSLLILKQQQNLGYIRFNLDRISDSILEAHLELSLLDNSSNSEINIIKVVPSYWNELNLDSIVLPSTGELINSSTQIIQQSDKRLISLDVSKLDKSENTFVLALSDEEEILIKSKESDWEASPKLWVTFKGDLKDVYPQEDSSTENDSEQKDQTSEEAEESETEENGTEENETEENETEENESEENESEENESEENESEENETEENSSSLPIESTENDNEINPSEEEFGYDIILIAGQSNTHGGNGYNSTLDSSEDLINQFGRSNGNNYKIINAIEPLDHHTKSTGKIGFGLTFAKLYKRQILNTNREILIIPCGKNSTGFKHGNWNKGDPLYNDMISRVNHVLKNYPNSKLKAILWHQGEQDVYSNQFTSDLDQFIFDVRNDINYESVPFILGGMVPYWVNQKDERINHQKLLANTVNRVNFVGYADPSRPYKIEKEIDDTVDEIHFDAAGQRELGRRYFDEYLKLR